MDVFRTSDAHWVVDINCRLKVAFKDRTGKFFTDIICLKKSWKRKISIKFKYFDVYALQLYWGLKLSFFCNSNTLLFIIRFCFWIFHIILLLWGNLKVKFLFKKFTITNNFILPLWNILWNFSDRFEIFCKELSSQEKF